MSHRPLLPLLSLAVVAVTLVPARAGDIPRLRTSDPHVRAALHEGLARSPALRVLVDRLAGGNVVAYVRCAMLPSHLEGRLTFMSAAGGLRYVVVRLACDRTLLRTIAALGHELQHVVEIAERREIVDQESLARAYAAIGFERGAMGYAVRAFDTVAAMAAGDRIRREMVRPTAADE
jgi:hypothetical protein